MPETLYEKIVRVYNDCDPMELLQTSSDPKNDHIGWNFFRIPEKLFLEIYVEIIKKNTPPQITFDYLEFANRVLEEELPETFGEPRRWEYGEYTQIIEPHLEGRRYYRVEEDGLGNGSFIAAVTDYRIGTISLSDNGDMEICNLIQESKPHPILPDRDLEGLILRFEMNDPELIKTASL